MKISKLIDGEKLHRDMEARFENLNNFILLFRLGLKIFFNIEKYF